jgi:SsrA-binding protein
LGFDALDGWPNNRRMATKTAPKGQSQSTNERRADRVVTSNRRAFHDYFIQEELETGISLTGSEIKSIRAGKASIAEAYARIENGELWLVGSHIAPYTHGAYANHEPDRPRKLLVHKNQVRELREMIERKGMTLIPLRLALRKGRAKVDIGVARGKKLYDKRAAEADREAARDIERAVRDRDRGRDW